MIKSSLLIEYMDLYPNDNCCYDEPNDNVVITHDGKVYEQPETETDESFEDRLNRCKKTGENLFVKEWEIAKYNKDVLY